jgi:hypothetical protein
VAHLGDRVADLVDGQLPVDAVERALAHLARCRPCREAVEAERLMKARLASLGGPEPGADLMRRLLALGGPNGPLPPRVGHVPGTPRPQAVALPRVSPLPPLASAALVPGGVHVVDAPTTDDPVFAGRSGQGGSPGGTSDSSVGASVGASGSSVGASGSSVGVSVGVAVVDRTVGRPPGRQVRPSGSPGCPPSVSTGPGRSRPRRRTRLAVAAVFGALSVTGVGIISLAAGGSGAVPATPTVNPPVDAFLIDHARTTSSLPFVDVSVGWQLTGAGQDGGAGR